MLNVFNIPPTCLYACDVNGRPRIWRISVEDKNIEALEIQIQHGLIGGKKQEVIEYVTKGKAGRNIFRQAQLQVESKINNQLQKGYKRTLEEAEKGRSNALGLPKPMLAQPFQKIKNFTFEDLYLQYKYNGHRCIIGNFNGEIIAYSRKGLEIKTIGHILEGLELPEGVVLDGELYTHGENLQTISSWVKKKQEGTENLSYVCYDIVDPLNIFATRRTIIHELFHNLPSHLLAHRIEFASTTFRDQLSTEDTKAYLDQAIACGYEGLILRKSIGMYEDGKRSKNLIKVKKLLDSEYKIIDIIVSDKEVPVVICAATNGLTFRVTAPGSREEKKKYYYDKDSFIGKFLTVEYHSLSSDGLPNPGIAVGIKETI